MEEDKQNKVLEIIKNNKALVLDSIWVGLLAGGIAIAYRIALTYADSILRSALGFVQINPALIIFWFAMLVILGIAVGKLIKWEPMISGSGLPQLKGEMEGNFNSNWLKVMIGKFAGGVLCILGGLSLGRAGPSIQFGAMAGKGISKRLHRDENGEKNLIRCGASAGLAATFNTPLAGVMFSLEQMHKKFSLVMMLPLLIAAFVASFISKIIFGFNAIFNFQSNILLPFDDYWLLLLLGIIIGILGVLNDKATLIAKKTFKKIKWLKPQYKIILPFIFAGVLGFILPQVMGCGNVLVELIAKGNLTLNMLLLLLTVKFLFSVICFGSGAPGGMFFPLLVIGAYIGGVFGTVAVSAIGLDPALVYNFVIIAIAGYFAAVVRTPITSIILVAELTGSLVNVIPITIVVIAAYLVAHLLKSNSIFDSLLSEMQLTS